MFFMSVFCILSLYSKTINEVSNACLIIVLRGKGKTTDVINETDLHEKKTMVSFEINEFVDVANLKLLRKTVGVKVTYSRKLFLSHFYLLMYKFFYLKKR